MEGVRGVRGRGGGNEGPQQIMSLLSSVFNTNKLPTIRFRDLKQFP